MELDKEFLFFGTAPFLLSTLDPPEIKDFVVACLTVLATPVKADVLL